MVSNNRYTPRYINRKAHSLESVPGAGITGGTGTVVKSSIDEVGDLVTVDIAIDLTGLSSSTTDLDIIGTGTSAAYLTQVTAAEFGTVLGLTVTCLEVPAGGVTDIDVYSATEGTGKFDDAVVTTLTETALLTSGGAWTLGAVKGAAAPAADQYIYLTGGAAGTAAPYTAGRFLLTFTGYK